MKTKIAFICVHNYCRSQIAEALAKRYASNDIEIYSAGTQLKDNINQDAIRLMKKIYDIDIEKTQKPKLLHDIPKVDYIIKMGCNVSCPDIDGIKEDWSIEDPSGKDDVFFIETIKLIEKKVVDLFSRIKK